MQHEADLAQRDASIGHDAGDYSERAPVDAGTDDEQDELFRQYRVSHAAMMHSSSPTLEAGIMHGSSLTLGA